MRIGVAKEIKSDEYRVALTPAGALELINHGHDVAIERGAGHGQLVRRFRLRARRCADRLGRRGVGRLGSRAEGQGADRVRVPPAARGPDPLHVPAHRGGRAADAARSLDSGITGVAYETVEVGRALPLLAPMSEVAGRLASQAGAYFLEKPIGGRGLLLGGVPGVAPGTRRDRRRRRRRLQRRRDRARARRAGDDPRALDRPHAPPRGDPLRPRRRC